MNRPTCSHARFVDMVGDAQHLELLEGFACPYSDCPDFVGYRFHKLKYVPAGPITFVRHMAATDPAGAMGSMVEEIFESRAIVFVDGTQGRAWRKVTQR